MARVELAIPNSYNVDIEVLNLVVRLSTDKQGHDVKLNPQSGSPVDNVRNRIVHKFLEGDSEYLLFIDSDNPPERNPLELVELDKDIMVCPTPFWKPSIYERGMGHVPMMWNVFDWCEEREIWREVRHRTGLHEICAGGTGCMLIARRVLETMREHGVLPWFKRSADEFGRSERGADLMFCKKARSIGFAVWCHWGYPCHHYKRVDLLEVDRAMQMRDVRYATLPNPNTKEYWDAEWTRRQERNYPYYEWIAEQVGGQRVLDFGCGRGDLLSMLGENAVGIDLSDEALAVCKSRGLNVSRSSAGHYDAIVATQVLEHVDDDVGLLDMFWESTDRVIYAVPHDCLPPGLEPEHRRVYTQEYCERITRYPCEFHEFGPYLVVDSRRPES